MGRPQSHLPVYRTPGFRMKVGFRKYYYVYLRHRQELRMRFYSFSVSRKKAKSSGSQ